MPAIVCVDRPPPALALRCIQLHLSLPTSLLVLAPESPAVGGASAKAVCCRVKKKKRKPATGFGRLALQHAPPACSADRVAARCAARRCCVGRTGSGVPDPPYISPTPPLISPPHLQVCCVGGARLSFAQLPRKEPERRDAWCAFCRRGAGCGDEEGPRDGPGDGPRDGPGDGLGDGLGGGLGGGLVVAWRPAAVMGSEEGEVPREVRRDGGEVRRDGGEVARDGSSGPEADAELFPPPVLSPIEQLLGEPSPNPSPNPNPNPIPDPNPNLGARSGAAVKVTRALDLTLIPPLS